MESFWKNQQVEILLVEDSPGDIRLTTEILKESRIPNHLHVVRDGEAAINFIHRTPPYQNAPQPDLILLDLNLPYRNGLEVLAAIRADEQLSYLPVIVLTTSQAERDIWESYHLHANCFVTKPFGLEEYITAVQAIRDFWLTVAQLPPH